MSRHDVDRSFHVDGRPLLVDVQEGMGFGVGNAIDERRALVNLELDVAGDVLL